jgi:sec-independent protein translocase protein TatA
MFRNPTTDLIVVLVIVLLIFGPKRLPQLGRQLGQGMREFRDGITGRSKGSDGEEPAEIEQTSSATSAPITAQAPPQPGGAAAAGRESAELAAPPAGRESAELAAPPAERESAEVAAPEPRG